MPRATFLLTISALCAMGQVTNYSIMIAGRTAGHETHTFGDDGSVRVAYSYNDRGRGPEIQGRYVFDREGMPLAIELSGQDYNHTPIDERFTVSGGTAHWKSRAESGESKSPGWYVAANGPVAQTAWLARALLRSRKPSMPLLPGGKATLEVGSSVEWKGQRVTMYSISGLDFTPALVWLDDRGDFFAGSADSRQYAKDSRMLCRSSKRRSAKLTKNGCTILQRASDTNRLTRLRYVMFACSIRKTPSSARIRWSL